MIKNNYLSNFSAAVRKHNLARPNLFTVEITLPPALVGIISMEDLRLVNVMCFSAFTAEVNFHTLNNYDEAGQQIKRAHGFTQTPISTFYRVDGNFTVKRFFDQWRRIITKSRQNFSWPDDYISDTLIITNYNTSANQVYTNTYKRIWPIDINQMSLDHGSTGETHIGINYAYETIEFSSDIMTEESLEAVSIKEKLSAEYLNKEIKI